MAISVTHFSQTNAAPRCRMYCKDESIYYQGEAAKAWFMVEEGLARTCRFHANGHRQVTGFHSPGDVFGLEDEEYAESAEAVTNLRCWCFNKPNGEMSDDSPEDEPSLFGQALRKARRNVIRCIHLFGRRTAAERLAAFILMMASRQGADDRVELAMRRSDIADFLGLTIYTVSRTYAQLCEDRLISLEATHHCQILDRASLRSLAGGED